MAFDSLHQPAGLLGDCMIFGNALHGLCVGNTVTRPNGATVAITPPFDQMSDCYAVRLAGVPDVVRTPAQAAADIADGLVWLADVILPGDTRREWLWRSSTGRTFMLDLQQLAPTSTVFVRAQPYGEIGAPAETPRVSTFPGFTVAEGAGPWEVWDINASGSAVLIGRRTSSPFDPAPTLHTRMLGLSIVAECTISQGADGWPVPAVTLRRSNADCLGSINTTNNVSGEAPLLVSWREFDGPELGPFQIGAPGAGVPPVGAVFATYAKAGTESSDATFTLSGRTLSCWYGSGGGIEYLTLTLHRSESYTRDYTHTATDETRFIEYSDVHVISASATYTYGSGGTALAESWGGTTTNTVTGAVPGGTEAEKPRAVRPGWNGVNVTDMTAIRYQMHLPQLNQDTAQTFGLLAMSKKIFAPFHAAAGNYTFSPARHPGGVTATAPAPVTLTEFGPLPVHIARDPRTGTLSSWSSVPVCFV